MTQTLRRFPSSLLNSDPPTPPPNIRWSRPSREEIRKYDLTVFCKWRQNLKDHFLLLVFRLFLEETHQLLRYVGGGKLLFAGL